MAMLATPRTSGALRGPTDGTAGWLGLAAAPVFALMAGVSAGGSPGMAICSAATGLPISDMGLMYLLMCIFHLPPWMKPLSGRFRRRNPPLPTREGD